MWKLIVVAALVAVSLLAFQCQPERSYMEDSEAKLRFTVDTVLFDTVFTTIGTVSKSFRIKNPHKQYIKIDEITLAGGNSSVFRVNVDGEPGTRFSDIEIAPKDSIYVFVEATLDPNESPDILCIEDSIVFVTNGNIQSVNLVAWGQDVHIIKKGEIYEPTIWPADKPYLVVDYLYVDTLASLTIEAGAKVHMHNDAYVYVNGTLEVLGSQEEPVSFQGDRLEDFYKDIPGQWGFLYFSALSHSNIVEYAEIVCGTMGIRIAASPESGLLPDLEISNSLINHMSSNGIYALNAKLSASNLVIGDCGGSCVGLLYGGSYDFTHCTFYNAWPSWYSNRQLPALFLADYFLNYDYDEEEWILYAGGEYEKAEFRNSIIYGNSNIELAIDSYDGRQMNYMFDYCLTKIDTDSMDYTTDPLFSNIINNEDPRLVSVPDTFSLDSISPAIDAGLPAYAAGVPFDIEGNSRLDDEAPDLGAYEWIKD